MSDEKREKAVVRLKEIAMDIQNIENQAHTLAHSQYNLGASDKFYLQVVNRLVVGHPAYKGLAAEATALMKGNSTILTP